MAVSPDGYLLACIYSRDDSDMREEPELYVWDLRPLVRNLLWSSRKDFVMFLVGCKYLPFLGDKSKCPSENRPDNVGIVSKSLSGLALEKSTRTTLQDTLLNASPVLENLLAYEACDESRSGKHQRLVDFVFGSNELMKYIVKFL